MGKKQVIFTLESAMRLPYFLVSIETKLETVITKGFDLGVVDYHHNVEMLHKGLYYNQVVVADVAVLDKDNCMQLKKLVL